MTSRFPRINARRGGFSLIEVAIALAVCVIVLAGVAGTWPSGQDRFKSAIDTTIAAQLAQRVSAEIVLADFPDVLRIAGIVGKPAPAVGSLPRRYFSYIGREVPSDDPDRLYEVLTRVTHNEQLPAMTGGAAARWTAQGQLVLTIEVVATPPGLVTPVGADGLVDRTKCRQPVLAFPFVVGGNATW